MALPTPVSVNSAGTVVSSSIDGNTDHLNEVQTSRPTTAPKIKISLSLVSQTTISTTSVVTESSNGIPPGNLFLVFLLYFVKLCESKLQSFS